MSERICDIVKLQRSSAYWVDRANRHRRTGNHRRAAALLRHAIALSPDDGDLRVAYARTLQEMDCYEASNRAAFGALTINPKRYACYGLIGRNMLALGYAQEAMDAFSRYLLAARQKGLASEYDEELDTLETMETERSRIQARYEAQLNIAGRRLSAGDLPRAERALQRAKPAARADDRYDSLRSLLLQEQGNVQGAVKCARRACRVNPRSARARCALAGAYCQAGQRLKGVSSLLAAALCCNTVQDAQLYCYSAVSLGFPELALCVLRRELKNSPNRLPALFNMAVVMLKLGRMDEADALLHRCRDLDPTDVPARYTARSVEQWRRLDLNPAQVRYAADALPLYPLLSPAEGNECLAQLGKALAEGMEEFCRALQEDEGLYNLFLYELGNPEHRLSRIVPMLAANLPREFAERMFRETLVQPVQDTAGKQYAAAALLRLGAKPPFVVWHAGRIAEIDPSVQTNNDADLMHSMLLRRLVDVKRFGGDSRMMTHALKALSIMSPERRKRIVRDTDGIYRAAMEQHYLMTYGLPETENLRALLHYNADDRRRIRAAFLSLCRLMPLPNLKPRK